MEWIPAAITTGEIDALKVAASQAWADDTRYPGWRGSSYAGGQCYVTAVWLTTRLGGYVGKKDGHFAWLSPNKTYVLDLTGDHSGSPTYEENDGYKPYAAVGNNRTAKFIKRANLVFDNLDVAVKVAFDGWGGDAFPGEEPQRETNNEQFWHDEPSLDDTGEDYKRFNFFYANGNLEVAEETAMGHDELSSGTGIDEGYTGPMASGSIEVKDGVAVWDVVSNIDVNALERVFRNYSDHMGWRWGGVGEEQDSPKVSKFNYVWANQHLYIGKASHTVLALNAGEAPLHGTIEIVGNKARINPAYVEALPQVFEWAGDQGLKLYGSSNNLIERNETMEQEDLGNPHGPLTNPVELDGEDDTPVSTEVEPGIHKCPICNEIFPDYHLYSKHRREEHAGVDGGEVKDDDGFPEAPDMDDINPAHFTESQPMTMPVYGRKEAARVDGFDRYANAYKYDDNDRYYVSYLNGSPVGYAVVAPDNELKMMYSSVRRKGVARSLMKSVKRYHKTFYTRMFHEWEEDLFSQPSRRARYSKENPLGGWVKVNRDTWVWTAASDPKDLLEAAVPFVYDIPADSITVGYPGQRTSDIPGKFTPAGIVEGMYEPGGTVNITTMTTMPYTVNHILTLWYYQHPELSVQRVNLIDAEGKKTKLANG